MSVSIDALIAAIDAIASERYGADDLEYLRAKDDYSVLRQLQAVHQQTGEPVGDDRAATAIADILEDLCTELNPEIAEVAAPLLGLGSWQMAGRNVRHDAASQAAKKAKFTQDFRHTTRPHVVRAIALKLMRRELTSQSADFRRELGPRVRERLNEQVSVAREHLAHLQHELPISRFEQRSIGHRLASHQVLTSSMTSWMPGSAAPVDPIWRSCWAPSVPARAPHCFA